jgi:GT2 family glycosyltransferase
MRRMARAMRTFFRIIKFLLSDGNGLYLVKMIPNFLDNLLRHPPDQFLQNILVWSKNLAAMQSKYYYSLLRKPLADDEYLAEWNFNLRRQSRKGSVEVNYRPSITLITAICGHDLEIIKETVKSVKNQSYENWEYYILLDQKSPLMTENPGDSLLAKDARVLTKVRVDLEKNLCRILNEIVEDCQGQFIAFLQEGDQLTRDALHEIVTLVNQYPDTTVIYTDEAQVRDNVLVDIYYKPGWSPDLLLSYNYLRNFLCCRKESIQTIGGFNGVFEDDIKYDILLKIVETTNQIYHLPKILYHEQVPKSCYPLRYNAEYSCELQKKALEDHLKRIDIDGEVCDGIIEGSFRVRRRISEQPKVNILIPTKDKVDLLERCIKSIESKTNYKNYEILVIDNESSEPASLKYLDTLPYQVIQYPEEFNFSRINNFAAEHATGDYLLFLNNDTEVVTPEWLEAMLEHAQRKEVGAVGAKLLYPDGLLQHAGMILVKNRWPDHVHRLTPPYDHGPYGMVDVIRNYNMVTAACMMMRASVFKEVGGFDENLPIIFNDIDLCFRIRSQGYLIVYTPYSVLYHDEGISRWSDKKPTSKDADLFFSRWKIFDVEDQRQ